MAVIGVNDKAFIMTKEAFGITRNLIYFWYYQDSSTNVNYSLKMVSYAF